MAVVTPPMLGAGWLAQDLTLPAHNHGVYVPRWSALEQAPFPTRTEEYWFVARHLDAAPRGFVMDAGTGFNPEIHLLPYILGEMGFAVLAADNNPHTLSMRAHPEVLRCWAHINAMPARLENVFDYWVCVSTLEHLSGDEQDATFRTAHRLLKPGGYALMTMDEIEPAVVNDALSAIFRTGPLVPLEGEPLCPRVAWAIAQKP